MIGIEFNRIFKKIVAPQKHQKSLSQDLSLYPPYDEAEDWIRML
jgi:hypothetical protein